MARDAVVEARLQGWAQWLQAGRRGDGYPTMSVLHRSWLPPSPGQAPSMKVVTGRDDQHRQTHQAVAGLSVRLANTVVMHYLLRLPMAEQAQRLECQPSTVYARVEEAHRLLAGQLRTSGGVRSVWEFHEL